MSGKCLYLKIGCHQYPICSNNLGDKDVAWKCLDAGNFNVAFQGMVKGEKRVLKLPRAQLESIIVPAGSGDSERYEPYENCNG